MQDKNPVTQSLLKTLFRARFFTSEKCHGTCTKKQGS